MHKRVNPDEETTDWRAVCGRTARTVRRAGRAKALPDPYHRPISDVGSISQSKVAYALSAPSNIPVGVSPSALASGNVDSEVGGNDSQDLVIADEGSGEISILLGEGDGSFAPEIHVPLGRSPRSVALADFNGDGWLDAATVNTDTNDVSILMGDGGGGFGVPTHLPVGTAPASLAVGDLDDNGLQDVAVANRVSSDVSILFGNGDGSFQPEVRLPAGVSMPLAVAIGDLDGNGHQDLAVVAHDFTGPVPPPVPPTVMTASILLGSGGALSWIRCPWRPGPRGHGIWPSRTSTVTAGKILRSCIHRARSSR